MCPVDTYLQFFFWLTICLTLTCQVDAYLHISFINNPSYFSPALWTPISFDVFICIWSFMFWCNYVLIFYSFVFLFINLHLVFLIHVYYVSSSCLFTYISSFCSFISLWLLIIYAFCIVISLCSYVNLRLHYFLYFLLYVCDVFVC